jgi:hypothetical protein
VSAFGLPVGGGGVLAGGDGLLKAPHLLQGDAEVVQRLAFAEAVAVAVAR